MLAFPCASNLAACHGAHTRGICINPVQVHGVSPLLALPGELLQEVLSHCSDYSRWMLSKTCKQLRATVNAHNPRMRARAAARDAAQHGHLDTLRMILEHPKGRIKARDVMDAACKGGHMAVMEELYSKGYKYHHAHRHVSNS